MEWFPDSDDPITPLVALCVWVGLAYCVVKLMLWVLSALGVGL